MLPVAPKPFTQMARREYRLGMPVRYGHGAGLNGAPWYRRGGRGWRRPHRARLADLWLRRLCRARIVRAPALHFLRCEMA